MTNIEEPLFGNEGTSDPQIETDLAVRQRIKRLTNEQDYAVLCVQGDGQPYGALVAFALSDDLRHMTFATPSATRKYKLLRQCDHVALVIDNRPTKGAELMEVEAVTATGRSALVDRGDEFNHWAELLVSRHPYLRTFVQAATCGLFRVDVVRYFHVVRFQEVRQWIPTDHS